ncbi:MAG: hypothetical protein HUU01_07110 [Saprospiraceae bacterium]|nr:hypothetical protein [Saprospiraceae bacterium]
MKKIMWSLFFVTVIVLGWWRGAEWETTNGQNKPSEGSAEDRLPYTAHEYLLQKVNEAPQVAAMGRLNPNALQLVGSPAAIQTMLDIIHRKLGLWYRFSIAPEGFLHLQVLQNQEPLSLSQRAFLSVFTRILSRPFSVALQVYDHKDDESRFVLIGKDRENAIDVGDMEKFGTNGWLTEHGVMAHELFESYLLQSNDLETPREHTAAHVLAASLEDVINEVPQSDAVNRMAVAGKLTVFIKTEPTSPVFDLEIQIWFHRNNVTHLTNNAKEAIG